MVKKKNRKVIGIVGVILALSLLFFATSGEFFAIPGTDQSSDLSVLSISETTINGEPAIRILATANGGSELLDIDWGEDYLNNYLDAYDIEATEPITGSIEVGDQSMEFPYVTTSQIIYKSVRFVDLGAEWSCSASNCEQYVNTGEELLGYGGNWYNTQYCQCLISSEKADVGKWSEISKKDYTVTFNIDGLGSATLNRNLQSVSLEDVSLGTYAKIKFQGLLGSYDDIDSPSYTPFLYNNQIYLLEPTSYTNIKNNYQDLFANPSYLNLDPHWDWINYNSQLTGLFIDKYNSYVGQSYIKSASRDSSGIKIILEQSIDYPVFTIDLNAEQVGIIKQAGQPSELTCSSFNFKSNELGETDCSVRNSGAPGGFRVDLSQCDGITAFMVGGNNLGSFNSQENKDFTVTLQGSTDNPSGESVNCDVRVYDVNEPSNDDTYKVSGTMEYNPGGLCSPLGNLQCSEDMESVMECNADGDYRLKSGCTYGCTYGNDGQALCAVDEDDNGECAWYDVPCKLKGIFAGISSFFDVIKYILVAVGSVFAFLFGKGILERIIKKKDKISIYSIWTIAILLGGLVGYILFTILFSWYFWLVIIGLIVLNFFITLVPLLKRRRRR